MTKGKVSEASMGKRGTAAVLLKKYAPLLVLLLFLATFPWWEKPLRTPLHINLLEQMRLIGLFTIVAVGLNLLVGYAGQISLGHGAFMGIGAYASALLAVRAHVPVYLSIPAAVVITVAIALIIAPVLRLKGHYLAMATLAFAIIIFIFLREMTWLTLGNTGLRDIPKLPIPGLRLTGVRPDYFWKPEYYVIWVIVLLALLFSRNLVASRPGRALMALHHSEIAAETLAIDTSRYKIKVFALSAAMAGLAGAIFAHLQGILTPTGFDFNLSIKLLVMVVIGGMASIWGSMAGAAFVVLLPKLLQAAPYWFGSKGGELSTNTENIIFGVSLILVMILMPSGLTRGISDLFKHRRNPFTNPLGKEGSG